MEVTKSCSARVGHFFTAIFLFIFCHPVAEACVGCGQTKVFSPKIVAISMSFILLPVTIVTLVFFKLRKDARADAVSAKDGTNL